MKKSMKVLAIIPARGGSKRIPRKNIRDFRGRPILHYSIQAALESGIFEEVMVSTDDEEISLMAQVGGAKVPFLRRAENADDYSTTVDVIIEVLEDYRERGEVFDFVCCLYATAPFVTGSTLAEAFRKLQKSDADAVFPITAYSYPPARSLRISDGYVFMRHPENESVRTQDIEPAYHDAGQYYFLRVEAFLRKRSIYGGNTLPMILPQRFVQDIDSEEDWKIAELKHQLIFG